MVEVFYFPRVHSRRSLFGLALLAVWCNGASKAKLRGPSEKSRWWKDLRLSAAGPTDDRSAELRNQKSILATPMRIFSVFQEICGREKIFKKSELAGMSQIQRNDISNSTYTIMY